MGNTSDRVSADRHGAKAQRSDSGGSQKDPETSSKMVDSTDDPNVFNTIGTKVLPAHKHEFKCRNPASCPSDWPYYCIMTLIYTYYL